MLRAHLFGGFALACNDNPVPALPSTTARSLLAYLITYGGRSHTRDLLAGTFWPDLPDDVARRRLSQALWQIRRALAPHPVLAADGDSVQLNPALPCWVDVAQFEQQIVDSRQQDFARAAERLVLAADLYRGDLLAGFYDDWVLAERERLRELFLAVLEKLVDGYKGLGDYERALGGARRLAEADPLREEAHREVMRLCHLLGRSAEALKKFEICRQVLEDELGVSPEAETVALAREIAPRAGAEGVVYLPVAAFTSAPVLSGGAEGGLLPLVGRQEERVTLLTHVEALWQGSAGIVLVEGEAGVGKTRLLQELARDAEWRGAPVLWGKGREMEVAGPYGPLAEALADGLSPLRVAQLAQTVDAVWLQALRPVLPPVARFLPNLPPPVPLDPAQEVERLVAAVVHFLAGRAQIAPLVLIIEDLHWAGSDTLDLLALVGRRLPPGVLLIGSYRSGEARTTAGVWDRLQALDRAGVRDRLVLTGLDAAGTGELIRRGLGLGTLVPLFEARLHRETGGNPLFVLETLRTLHGEGLLRRDAAGQWSTPWDGTTPDYAELPLTPAVERAIARRLDLLRPFDREVLGLAAVLGERFDTDLLQAASDRELPALLAGVGELLRRQFLVETACDYRFGHDEIRRVAYAGLEAGQRAALHRRAGLALEALHPGHVEALAYHFFEGRAWDKAADYGRQAGDQAGAVHANQSALAHYSRVLELLDRQAPYGSEPAGWRLAEEMRFDILSARQRLFWVLGQVEHQQADLEAMLTLADRLQDDSRRLVALNQQANFLCITKDEADGARQAAQAALDLSTAVGDRRQEATALELLGLASHYCDDYQQALNYYRRAREAWQAAEDHAALVKLHIRLARTHRNLAQLDEAAAELDAAMAVAGVAGDRRGEMYALDSLAIQARRRGDNRAAADLHEKSLRLARAIGQRSAEAAALDNLGTAYWGLRDYGRAAAAMRQSLQIVRDMAGQRDMVFCLNNLGHVHREMGALDESRAYLDEGLALAREIRFRSLEGYVSYGLGRLCLDIDDLAAAQAWFDVVLAIARQIDMPDLAGSAQWGLGLVRRRQGDLSSAACLLEQAVDAFSQAGEVTSATAARSDLAACCLGLGDVERAVRLSTRAVAELEAAQGGEEIQAVYLHHAQILQVAGQPAAARAALGRARDTVLAQADTLPTPAGRQTFLERVPANREVLAVWAALQAEEAARQVRVRLPRAGAPLRRALHDDEYVMVVWTVADPQDGAIPDRTDRRQARLCRLLREAAAQGAAPTVDDLAAAMEASRATVKRDLAALRQAGGEVRTRGSPP